jgi:hypothetical protein
MADGAAWDQGWALGSRIAEQGHARKQQLSDEDRKQKAQLLGSQLENLRTKIQSLPKDSPEYQQTFSAMQDTLKNVKELFHPDTHPGLIASHGHLITDALRLTNAKDRQGKQDRKQFAEKENIEKQAQNLVPVSPEQEAISEANSESAANLVAFQNKLKLYDQNHPEAVGDDATPEGKQMRQEFINGLITQDVKEPKEPVDIWTPVKDAIPEEYPKGSGQYRIVQVNKKGEYRYQQLPEGYISAPPKQQKMSNIETERESYRKENNIPAGQPLTFKQEQDFVKKLALARNPLGPQRIELSREGLNLRESEANVKDFLALQKQLTPLERVIDTSTKADEYVTTPTGPGDVALTLAFFDAIKTQGVRFTKQEQDFILNSRGALDSAQAAFDKGFEGTVFGPPGSPQRAQIAAIVKKGADFAKTQKNNLVGGVGAFNPKAAAATGGSTPASNSNMTDDEFLMKVK